MKKEIKISLLISVIGILLLLFILNFASPKKINIEEINDHLLNEKVIIEGSVFSIKNYEDSNFQVISIKDQTGRVDVTASKITNLKNNDKIRVFGVVKEYREYLQIQADKIELLS